MAIVSARDLEAAENPEVRVSLPSGGEMRCARVDLATQLFAGLLSLPLVRAACGAADDLRQGATEAQLLEQHPAFGEFLDRWVCLVAREPRVVLTAEEASDTAIWVRRLTLPTRLAIFDATFTEPVAPVAAGEFSRGALGPAARSRRPSLWPAPLDANRN